MGVTAVFVNLDDALAGVERTGVVHVGAHRGQEVPAYRAAGFGRIVLIEPNPEHWDELRSLRGPIVEPVACGNPGFSTLHRTKWDEQSSLLRPQSIEVVDTVEVFVQPLSDFQDGVNVAVLDVQGSELEVLQTAHLDRLDALIVEQDANVRYDGAAAPDDVRAFLLDAGWTLSSTWPHRWDFLTEEVWLRGD